MQAWVLGEAVNGPPTYGSFPPSLSVAAISREMGDGRLTSEMYFARSPSAEHTDVPRACYPALPMESSVYSISPCLTGPNPPTKKRAISAGEFRCTYVQGPLRAPVLPLPVYTFFTCDIFWCYDRPPFDCTTSRKHPVSPVPSMWDLCGTGGGASTQRDLASPDRVTGTPTVSNGVHATRLHVTSRIPKTTDMSARVVMFDMPVTKPGGGVSPLNQPALLLR